MYWEKINNSSFNFEGYELIREKVGLNGYMLFAENWIEETAAIGIQIDSNSIHAAQEIALEFHCWLNPIFKLLFIKSLTSKTETSLRFSEFYGHTSAIKS